MTSDWLRTGIGHSDADSITLMGRDLAGELMGHVSLTELAFLLVRKRTPTAGESRLLDAVLVSLADHGLTPIALSARLTYTGAPESLQGAIAAGTARVVERPDRISGYATGFGYGWHAVAEGNEDLQALIASAEAFVSLGILVPSRNATLLGWCLDNGLRLVQQSTLMTVGLYNEPQGAWLPSIVY